MKGTRTENGYFVGEIKSGKYLRILIKVSGEKIEDIKIIGDFFAFPEDSIEALEEKIKGCTVNEAFRLIESYPIELLGISKEDIKNAIRIALKEIKEL